MVGSNLSVLQRCPAKVYPIIDHLSTTSQLYLLLCSVRLNSLAGNILDYLKYLKIFLQRLTAYQKVLQLNLI